MIGTLKWRLFGFIMVIALLVGAIFTAANKTWGGIRLFRERLTAVELESFHLADHFQREILNMNNKLLEFQLAGEDSRWEDFVHQSEDLTKWLSRQATSLNSGQEKHLLKNLNSAYTHYLAVARDVRSMVSTTKDDTTKLAAFARFEQASESLLSLVSQLANAHRESLGAFLAESNASLRSLQAVLVASLISLLICGAGLAAVVYRGLIAPLRIKLVQNQELLDRQEKLASLGMLAAGVAHEIRNPLTAIKARLYTLHKRLTPGSPDRIDTEVIDQEINRLERIVKDFLLFARPSDPKLALIPACEPFQKVHALLRGKLEESQIHLLIDCSLDSKIEADPQQLQQVLINLVQNSADAIGKDGQITLRARSDLKLLKSQMREVFILEVEDTGGGIPPDVEKRLFDPFFSTKESGTGLGLSIAARIVEKHGGALQYQTLIGHGTTFGIVLPKVQNETPCPSDEKIRGYTQET